MKEIKISINQTYNGKAVCDMTTKERLQMEALFMNNGYVVSYSYDDNTDEVAIPDPKAEAAIKAAKERMEREKHWREFLAGKEEEKKKYAQRTFININGHSYDSWEEAMKGEAASGNVKVINNTAGSTVTIANGKVIVGGAKQFGFDPQKQNVYIFVKGDCDNIEVPAGTVHTTGNIGNVHANAGNVTANVISGNVHANCGNIKAETIKGNVHSNMGHVTYNGK